MPYIKPVDEFGRHRRDLLVGSQATPENVGELNFQLSMCIIGYMDAHGLSYQTINDISGAMTEAMAEFRRRVIEPYEDKKIAENGDLPYNVRSSGGGTS